MTCLIYNLEIPQFTWIIYSFTLTVICTLLGEFICFRLVDKKIPDFNGMLDTEDISKVKDGENEVMKKRKSLNHASELSKLV